DHLHRIAVRRVYVTEKVVRVLVALCAVLRRRLLDADPAAFKLHRTVRDDVRGRDGDGAATTNVGHSDVVLRPHQQPHPARPGVDDGHSPRPRGMRMTIYADGAHDERTPRAKVLSCGRVAQIDHADPRIANS